MSEARFPKIYEDQGVEAVRIWWRELQDNPGDRAHLRRASTLIDLALYPAYHGLRRRVSGDPERLALVAGVLARIKEPQGPKCFAKALAAPKSGGSGPCMSGMRFRRLLKIEEPGELMRQMRRALALAGDNADPGLLAKDIYSWDQPWVKRTWAQTYYDTAQRRGLRSLIMSRFLQIHLLTPYHPSNLNRDDLGRPKTAIIGGKQRLRISSQSLKRAWRTSGVFQDAFAEQMGTRTKEMGRKVAGLLEEKGVSPENAAEWAAQVGGVFGKNKKKRAFGNRAAGAFQPPGGKGHPGVGGQAGRLRRASLG